MTELHPDHISHFEEALTASDPDHPIFISLYRGTHLVARAPLRVDSDADGMTDYEELNYDQACERGFHKIRCAGLGAPDPFDRDSDDDGLLDGEEFLMGTCPLQVDTDGDGLADSLEVGMTATLLNEKNFGDAH